MVCSTAIRSVSYQLHFSVFNKHIYHTHRLHIMPINRLLFEVFKIAICNTSTRCLQVLPLLRHLITTQATVDISVQGLYDRSELRELSYFWGSPLSPKGYAGTSQQGRERNKQHYTAMKNNYQYKHDIKTTINPAHNTRFYKYITKVSGITHFFMMPLVLIAKIDAVPFEDCLIRYLGTRALNEDRRRDSMLLAKKTTQVVLTTKNKRVSRTTKRKRTRKPDTHRSYKTHYHNTTVDFVPKLYRVDTDDFFYHRLDSLFTNNENNTIIVHITVGKSLTHSHNFLHC